MNKISSIDSKPKKPSLYISVRFLVAIIQGLCYLLNYMQRTNMSFAIVCMVNSTAVLELESSNIANSTTLNQNCVGDIEEKNSTEGKFIWLKSDQGLILSAYFYGYIITQIPGGWLALKYGGLWVIGLSMLASSILTIIMAPIANLNSIPAIFTLRFLTGFCHGFLLPAQSFMFVKWAPISEKSRLIGMAVSWTNIGSVVSTLFGSYLCEYGFYEGWGSIFILFGGFGIVWFLCLFLFTSESPENHRFISEVEKKYIIDNIPQSALKKKKLKTPWKAILKSKACIGIFISHFCLNWGAYLFLTQTPTYMKDVLKFDIKSNGLYSSIPYLASFICVLGGGYISDRLILHGIMHRTNVRKLFNSISMFIPMVCSLLLGLVVDCTQPFVGVLLLTIGVGTMGFVNSAGYGVNINEIGGQYAGILYGISNTFATIPGIVAPYVVGLLTPIATFEEWRVVFIITSVICFIGGLPFFFFAKTDIEDWARVDIEQEQEKDKKDVELMDKKIIENT